MAVAWSAITGAVTTNAALKTALDAKQATSQRGKANGYAPLDANNKVPDTHLPSTAPITDAAEAYTDTAVATLAAAIATRLLKLDGGHADTVYTGA